MTERKPEWQVIVDLLEATDSRELNRIARKLLNYLLRMGVPEASALLEKYNQAYMNVKVDDNKPTQRTDLREVENVFQETFKIAEKQMTEDELSSTLMNWVSEGRTRFLSMATEKQGITLFEIIENLNRFCKLPEKERTLSEAEAVGIKVSLIRRFLSDTHQYINVAKKFIRIEDIGALTQKMIGPGGGTGRLGGKGAGLFIAEKIIEKAKEKYQVLQNVRVPKTWFLLSDGIVDFLHYNALEEVINLKYRRIDEVRHEYPYFQQVFKQSHFSSEIMQGLSLALDELEGRPIIVRSSSLLEDSFGAAFSGKYRSIFIANKGTKMERMDALMDAIAEVYASTFSPDAFEYRVQRDLVDYQEQMGCLIEEVVGNEVGGRYYMPTFAGVAFSNNEFRWSPRIKRRDSMIRLVAGLGTRAVDRVGDDYPMLIAPGQPNLRVNTSPEDIVRYSQKYIDVIDLHELDFKTLRIDDLLESAGDEYPALTKLVSVYSQGNLSPPSFANFDPKKPDLVFTFDGLLTKTPFIEQIKILLDILAETIGTPVDIEFASNGLHLYILQCRPQAQSRDRANIHIPDDVAPEDKIFTANKFVSDGYIPDISYVVYVDPTEYDSLETIDEMLEVGKIIGQINNALPKGSFILMGPGRWGSRGDIKLGVGVTYSDINKTSALIEIAKKKGGYVPEVSFGTHFFQDLVESNIHYLPLYPDDRTVIFNSEFIKNSPNSLASILPSADKFEKVIKIIDVPATTGGKKMRLVMDGDNGRALAFLDSQNPEPAEEN